MLHPELLEEQKQKVEQSVNNMMISNKGTSLDQQKLMTQLGLEINWCKGIKASESTKYEKLLIDKQKMESEEEKAIFRMLCQIKQHNLVAGTTEPTSPAIGKQSSVDEVFEKYEAIKRQSLIRNGGVAQVESRCSITDKDNSSSGS